MQTKEIEFYYDNDLSRKNQLFLDLFTRSQGIKTSQQMHNIFDFTTLLSGSPNIACY